MKYSYVMLPDYPLSESLAAIKLADQLGFYGCYAADETWHKDLWLLFAAAAAETSNIRFGPSLSSVVLREPTLIAQSLATLDELTGGRAEAVLSCGNFGLLAQYNIDWTTTKPLSRVKEAHHVVRTLLDDGAITFDGEFFKYSGLFTFARPVQEHVPVLIGAMRGPKSFQAAGELSDGCHHALSYTREAYDFAVENIRIGAEKAGKDADSLDIGAWVVFATGAGLGEGQGRRQGDGRDLCLVHARRATRAQRRRSRGAQADHRRDRRRRPRQGHRADVTRAGRPLVGFGLAGRVRGQDPRRDRARPASTTWSWRSPTAASSRRSPAWTSRAWPTSTPSSS